MSLLHSFLRNLSYSLIGFIVRLSDTAVIQIGMKVEVESSVLVSDFCYYCRTAAGERKLNPSPFLHQQLDDIKFYNLYKTIEEEQSFIFRS